MYNFDKTDVKIVNLLLEDGRMSASEIARRLRGYFRARGALSH
jgi:DNA-binding Lrp family transcriptional regulator